MTVTKWWIVAALAFAGSAWLLTRADNPSGAAAAAPQESAARATHRIVFQMTAPAPDQWDGVLNNVESVRAALGEDATQIEVVVHSKGIGMVLKEQNQNYADRMRALSEKGVVFVACENTLARKKLTRNALLDFVKTVDSGVAQVVRRQEQGWSYIRIGD